MSFGHCFGEQCSLLGLGESAVRSHTHAKCMDGSRFFTRVCVSVSKILSKLVRVRAEYSKHQQGNAVDETMGE